MFNPYVVGRDPVAPVRQVALADQDRSSRVGYIEYLEGVGSAAPFSDVGVSALYEDAVASAANNLALRQVTLADAPHEGRHIEHDSLCDVAAGRRIGAQVVAARGDRYGRNGDGARAADRCHAGSGGARRAVYEYEL